MRMTMFSGAVIILLSAHKVLGFGMLDFLRAARQAEAQHLRRPLTSPANAIVEVFQRELDNDVNGEISIPEVGAYIDWCFNPEDTQPFTPRRDQIETKRYMMTLANLIDANGDGNITTAELRRATEILVNNVGNTVVGVIIDIKRYYKTRRRFSPETEARNIIDVFMEAADSNTDGEISADERQNFFESGLFLWHSQNDVNLKVEAADGNGDENLSKAEGLQFLVNMGSWSLRKMLTYLEIYERAGKQIADEWASYKFN